MNNSQQLIKKDKSQVYPKTFLDAIKSRETGQSLDEILQGFNMYFVSYNGNVQLSRCQVPIELRKRGLWITYINFQNEVVTEWYDAKEVDNTSWGDNRNWRQGNNRLVGDITISANGNWIVNGKELDTKAKGDKGETPLLRYSNLALEVSYNKGKKWEELTKFENKLAIQGYVAAVGDLPKNAVQGDIWMVGPTYDEGDELQDYPHYRMWVRNENAWKDNGEFTSLSVGIAQETGDNPNAVMSQKASADTYGKLIESPEYVRVLTDSSNKIIFAADVDGDLKIFTNIHLSKNKTISGANLTEATIVDSTLDFKGVKQYFMQNQEYLYIITDSENKIAWGIKSDGTIVGQQSSLPSEEVLQLITDLQEQLNQSNSQISANAQKINSLNTEVSNKASIIQLEQLQEKTKEFEKSVIEQFNTYKPIQIIGEVTNAADEEDLTSTNGLLKLKSRNNLQGKGYKIIRQEESVLDQMYQTNTIYEIRYNTPVSSPIIEVPISQFPNQSTVTVSSYNFVYLDTPIQLNPNEYIEVPESYWVLNSSLNRILARGPYYLNTANSSITVYLALNSVVYNEIIYHYTPYNLNSGATYINERVDRKLVTNALDQMLLDGVGSYQNTGATLSCYELTKVNTKNLSYKVGKYLRVPANSTLYFNGGKLYDGIIIFNDTLLLGDINIQCDISSDYLGKLVNSYITPQMFGAKGDGVTDDTLAIRRACNAGCGTVIFPKGTYIVNVPKGNLIEEGNRTLFRVDTTDCIIGQEESIIKLGKGNCHNPNYTGFCTIFLASGYQNAEKSFLMKDMTIDFNYSENPIYHYTSNHQGVEDNSQQNAIYATRMSNLVVDNCKFLEHSGTNCITVDPNPNNPKTNYVQITNCIFSKVGQKSLFINKDGITEDAYHDHSTIAIHPKGNTSGTKIRSLIANNYFEGIGGNAYDTCEVASDYWIFEHNYIVGYDFGCLPLLYSDDDSFAKIINNKFIDCGISIGLWNCFWQDKGSEKLGVIGDIGFRELIIQGNYASIDIIKRLQTPTYSTLNLKDENGYYFNNRPYGFLRFGAQPTKSIGTLTISDNVIEYASTQTLQDKYWGPKLYHCINFNYSMAFNASKAAIEHFNIERNVFKNLPSGILRTLPFAEFDTFSFNNNKVINAFSAPQAEELKYSGLFEINLIENRLNYNDWRFFEIEDNLIDTNYDLQHEGAVFVNINNTYGVTNRAQNSILSIRGNKITSLPTGGLFKYTPQSSFPFKNSLIETLTFTKK